MMDGGALPADDWRQIAAQKEKEWKDVTEQRIQSLEQACKEKDKCLDEERAKFQKLKEDFKYNFKLLEARDQELDRYDISFADLKAQLNVRNVEVSACKIQVDELRTQLNCEAKSREELQLHYQARVREKQAEIDSYRNTKDGELNEERKEFESFKRKLQRKLTEVEDELDAQKRELTAGFEEAMRKREHEFRIQMDDMNAKVLEHELKAKLLGRELELVRAAQEKNNKEFGHIENNHRELEKKLKEKDWELEDFKAMQNAIISDLEGQLQQKELIMKRMQEEYERKHIEMDKYCREKEMALSMANDANKDREEDLQNQIRELQSKLEDAQVECRKLQWSSQDLEKEKNTYIEKLQAQSRQLKDQWDKQIVQVSRDQVSKDLKLQNLQEMEEKHRLEIVQRKEDIERYKKELSSSVEREAALERSKTQMELDWQRRYEDLERQQYERSEDLVKKLTTARDEALAALKEKTRNLQQRDTLIKVLKSDRQQAYAALNDHGIKLDKNIKVQIEEANVETSEEIANLQEQNESLKAVISEMRKQMEQIGQEIPESEGHPKKGMSVTEEYVKDLEKECRELRQKIRELDQDGDVARRFGRPPAACPTNQDQVMTEVKDNMVVKNHIESLNDHIGSLRTEKVELSAQVKKQQAHMLYQEKAMEKYTKEQREKQVVIDQLQYELGAATRRSQTEVASLCQKVSELELQLVEARKEADEYYKSNLERNMEVTSLAHELSNMKLLFAEKRPSINYGAQELLIQQLQDEIMNLKTHGAKFSGGSESVDGTHVPGTATQVQHLHEKLKSAAKLITDLVKERHQLIEMGQMLTAKLKLAGLEIPVMASGGRRPSARLHKAEELSKNLPSPQPYSDKFVSKLGQLEKLQYQLTRQELQYAQKYHRLPGTQDPNVSDTEEHRPGSLLKAPSNLRNSMDTEVNVRASVNTNGGETMASLHSIPTVGSQRSQLMMSMSSMGGESLQEIWNMLDEVRPSPTPRESSPGRQQHLGDNQDDGKLRVSGRQTSMQNTKQERKMSDKAQGKVFKKVQQKPNVRNYNIKKDTNVS